MLSLYFEKLSRFDRPGEPCTVAVPLPRGELSPEAPVAVCDGDRLLPTQCRITSTWPDGSVRWLLVHFLADLPGNTGKRFTLRPGTPSPPPHPVVVEPAAGGTQVRTGDFWVEVTSPGEPGLFRRVALGPLALGAGEFEGPLVRDGNGEAWFVEAGPDGWEVVEAGPVRAVLQTRGKHRGGKGWLDFTLRVYAWAGAPWIRVDYQVMHREPEREVGLEEMRFAVRPAPAPEVRTALATSNYGSRVREGDGRAELRHQIDAEQLIYESNEQVPETLYGTFWADWNAPGRGGVCVTLYQAQQNFPKALAVDERGLRAWFLPPESGGVRLLQGMAKTHRFFLHFHGPEAPLRELNVRSLQFQMPDRPVLDEMVYQRAGGLDPVGVKALIPEVERALIDLADHRTRAYGILHWGDGPDAGYTFQGRGHGEMVWTNNEYDLPHAALLLYQHTGERRLLDYLLVAAEHWMDVDVCHFSADPMRHQGQIIHSAGHATGGVAVSHQWVEGLLDYYHQTGERFAYDTALGIGENVLRHLERPSLRQVAGAAARETGWALRTLVALYDETHDERWLHPAEFIVGQFEAWQGQYGAWLAPYTDHTLVRVPFMIAVAANSLMRYYRVRPEPRVQRMIVHAVRDLLEHCLMPDGRFYYKELPSLQRRGASLLVLEALAYAYELSGDLQFLHAGLPSFRIAVAEAGRSRDFTGPKFQAGDAVIVPDGAGPKAFAAGVPQILVFYRALTAAGLTLN
ncbi:MAG: hypothetical protein QHJ73_06890 [Armatimonadota bacterium]|nr:hypothetical protein [Armatimonadota bacterium]